MAHAAAYPELDGDELGTSANAGQDDRETQPFASSIAHAAAVGDWGYEGASSRSLPPIAGQDDSPYSSPIEHAAAVGDDGYGGASASLGSLPPIGQDDIEPYCCAIEHAAAVGDGGYDSMSSKSLGQEALLESEREAAEIRTRALLDELGIKPVVDFVPCFPPEGIYYNLGMLALGYASHLGQTLTFIMQKDWATAGLMALVLAVAWYYSWCLLFRRPGLTLGLKRVSHRLQRCIRSGVEDPELQTLVALGSSITSAFGTLLAPYRLLGIVGLSWPSAANAAMGLMLHTKSLADQMMCDHFGGLQRQYGKAVVKSQPGGGAKCLALQIWALCTMGAQVALTAIVARLWHPLVAILLFAPVAAVRAEVNFHKMSQSRKTSLLRLFLNCYLEPGNLLAPVQSSVFGLHQWDAAVRANLGNVPALHHCAAQAFRLVVIACLLCLDSGVFWGQLGKPALGCFEGEVSPDAAFKLFVLLFLLGALPVSLCGFESLLATNPCFRDGEQDEEACARMDEMKEVVEACLRGEIP